MNSRFIFLKIKKKYIPQRIFQNDFLPSRFPFWRTHFAYKTSIPKISFAYRIFIPESSKIFKDNFGIA